MEQERSIPGLYIVGKRCLRVADLWSFEGITKVDSSGFAAEAFRCVEQSIIGEYHRRGQRIAQVLDRIPIQLRTVWVRLHLVKHSRH
jgi:hypothetical protein